MEIVQYKCPNCGGPLKFDPKSGMHTCEYCRSSFTQKDVSEKTNIGKQAGGSAGPASVTSDTTDASIEDAKVYTCPSCGATIVTDSTTAATFCYYCHNPVVLSGRLSGEFKPDYVVPFRISREKALQIFESWIGRKKYVPKAFYSKDQIEKFTGIYFPYLLYTCDVSCHIDTEGTKVRVYSEGMFDCTERTRYHIVRDGSMDVQHIFRNALKKANATLADGVLPFSFSSDDMKPFNMSYLSGFFAEKRDIDCSSLQDEMKNEIRDYAISRLQTEVSGYEGVKIDAGNISISNEKWEYALCPVWSLTYNDKGKIYYFSVNGQSGKTVGELPVDTGKLIRTFLLIFIPVFLALLALFYFIF